MIKVIATLFAIGAVFAAGLLAPRKSQAATGDIPVNDTTQLTRGERNNNPGNIEYNAAIQWRGQTGTDGRYAQFDTPLNGLRALMINLHTYMYKHGLRTVREWITRWAPGHENPTDAYIDFVAQRAGVGPDSPLNWHVHIIPVTRAIVEFENGRNRYDLEMYELAKNATGR